MVEGWSLDIDRGVLRVSGDSKGWVVAKFEKLSALSRRSVQVDRQVEVSMPFEAPGEGGGGDQEQPAFVADIWRRAETVSVVSHKYYHTLNMNLYFQFPSSARGQK
jgi:hypothetical protein